MFRAMSNELVLHDDSGKAFPHVVTALIAKRAELAGQIEHAQGEVKRLTIALDHVEETLRLFAPDIDVAAISPRPVPPAHQAFRGEVSRIILESLRTATGPLSTVQLTSRVMRETAWRCRKNAGARSDQSADPRGRTQDGI